MGKTIHVVSDAAGTILKASKSQAACEAYINGSLGSVHRTMEPVQTPNGDPAMLYRTADGEMARTQFVLTTLRLS